MSSNPLNRRTFLAGSVALGSATLGAGLVSVMAGAKGRPTTVLQPRVTEFGFVDGKPTKNVLSYADKGPAPILRVRQGEELRVQLRNQLKEPTTIHWHGIRLPNAMDGVPFLTQPYVNENEQFEYAFKVPDAGSFWFHPHCNSLQQLGYGLTGLLIVEEAKDPGFDGDIAINLRDWRLGQSGQFIKLYNPRQSARAGTHGAVRTANWQNNPVYDAKAGSLVRLRLIVTDVTRVYKLAIEGGEGRIIALDGNPLPEPMAMETFAVGPGQRMDVVVRMPDGEGESVEVRDYSVPNGVTLARVRSVGASLRRDLRDVQALPQNPVPEPDLANATKLDMEFTATADQIAKSPFCGDLGFSFWAINRRPWAGSSPDPTLPIAEFKLGRSYVISLFNRTPHPHPIHLHGMSFKPIASNRRSLPPVWTDTALVMPDERIDVALVADNIGDWLLHCHIIEHQETGMAGFVRVA